MADIILKNGIGQPIEYKNIETIEVPQADVTIIPETEFSGFAYDEAFGLYILDAPLSLLTLEVGEKYEVIWDGATFICECQDLSAMSNGALGVGNLADFGGTGNGEPFVVAIVDGMLMLASFTEGEKHTVTIAKIGGTQIFSEGVATSATVELNFTDVVEKEIYPERTLEDFAFNETWGAYTSLLEPIFDLVLGEKYKVYWDGEWYECETQDAGAIMAGALMLGNGSMFGLSGNNEPFAIGWLSAGITFLSVGSEATSHTVAVNQFVAGMEIVPNDNEVFSKVTIPKPDTLVPENIAEGVDVAGVTGTFVGGSDVTSISKVITFSSKATGIVTLFTANELSAIGFDTSKWCMVSLMAVKPGGGDYGTKRLTFNVISNQNFNRHVQTTSRLTYGVTAETDVATPTAIYTTYDAAPPAFSGTAQKNSMYYKDGAILYDATNSTNILNNKYVLTAVCMSV